MHVRFVAGKFLDRINRIDRILAWRTGEAGGILGLLHPALSTPLATLLRNAHYVRVIFLRRSLRSGDTQTPPKTDLNSPVLPD